MEGKISALEKEIKQLEKKGDNIEAVKKMSELSELYRQAGDPKKAQEIYEEKQKLTIKTLKALQVELLKEAKSAEKEERWEDASGFYAQCKEIASNLLDAGQANQEKKIKEFAELEEKCRLDANLNKMNVKQLLEYCKNNNIEVPPKTKKADIIKIIYKAPKEKETPEAKEAPKALAISKELKDKISALEKEIKQLKKKGDNVEAAKMMAELAESYKEAGDMKKAQETSDTQKKLTIVTLKKLQADLLKEAKNAEKNGKWDKAADLYSQCKEIASNLLKAGETEQEKRINEFTELEEKCRSKAKEKPAPEAKKAPKAPAISKKL